MPNTATWRRASSAAVPAPSSISVRIHSSFGKKLTSFLKTPALRAAKPGFVRSVLLAHTAGGLDAEGVTLDRGAVENVILPLGVQAVYAADLPIGEILALEIHDVVTGR